ncbi:MAG: hypothetical protein AAFV53_13105 [Myxococcota bacterium]
MSITRKQRAQLGRLLRGGHITQAIELGQALAGTTLTSDQVRHLRRAAQPYRMTAREQRWMARWTWLSEHLDLALFLTRRTLLEGLNALERVETGQLLYASRERLELTSIRACLATNLLLDISLYGASPSREMCGYIAVTSLPAPKLPTAQRVSTTILDAICDDGAWMQEFASIELTRIDLPAAEPEPEPIDQAPLFGRRAS